MEVRRELLAWTQGHVNTCMVYMGVYARSWRERGTAGCVWRQYGTLTLLEWQSSPRDLAQVLKTRLKKAGEGERKRKKT